MEINSNEIISWLESQNVDKIPVDTINLDVLSTDSRTIKPQDVYLPLVGAQFDGHQFIADSLTKGAATFFYHRNKANHLPPSLLNKGIAVDNTLITLQTIASNYRSKLQ